MNLPVALINTLGKIGLYDIEVLRKYLGSSKYNCTFCSDSYGRIGGSDFDIAFGTIEHKLVILWGNDFHKLPDPQKSHFIENKNSLPSWSQEPGNKNWEEKIMNTEFYQAQVEIVYTDPIKEVTLYQKYDILNNLWQEKFDCRLFKNESKDIIEILNLCTKYKKIVLSSFDDFRSFITDWNILILEGLDANNLKISAGNAQVEVKNDHGSRIILKNLLKQSCLPPLTSLEDLMNLRNYADHRENEEKKKKYNLFCSKAGTTVSEYMKIYYFLLDELIEEFDILIKALDRA